MLVGVPREIKMDEYRVGMIPKTVTELVTRGHDVWVETGAGVGAGISDDEYRAAGARVAADAASIFERADLIVKVKEPLKPERARLRRGQTIFAYLHLAPDPEQTEELVRSGVTAIAYETVADSQGHLPLLAPMSEVAGRMAPQVAAHLLERPHGGRGILLGGVRGSPPAKMLIVGGGTVARQAATVAIGMGADVTLVARSPNTLDELRALFGSKASVAASSSAFIEAQCESADVIVGAALVPGASTPKLISARMVATMKRGAVIVDVSIDQGGCAETSRPTTHSKPVYVVDHVIHYCVANMPGAVPQTSTLALSHATEPYILALADKGLRRALSEDQYFRNGLNVHAGMVTNRAVADALKLPYAAPEKALELLASL